MNTATDEVTLHYNLTALDKELGDIKPSGPINVTTDVRVHPPVSKANVTPIDSKKEAVIKEEVDRNRSSTKSQRFVLVEHRKGRISQLEEQIERVVATNNVRLRSLQDEFGNTRSSYSNQRLMLLKQLEEIDRQFEQEKQEYNNKISDVESRYADNLKELQILLRSEQASLAILTEKEVTTSAFAESAVAQAEKKSDTFSVQSTKATEIPLT